MQQASIWALADKKRQQINPRQACQARRKKESHPKARHDRRRRLAPTATAALRLQPEPQREQLPYPLPLARRPRLQRPCTRLALRELRALQLAELLRDVQRVPAPALAVEEVVLRRQVHELREVLPARRRGHAHAVRVPGLARRGGHGVPEPPAERAAARRVPDVLPAAHALDERGDGVLARLFAEEEPLQVVRQQRGGWGRAVERVVLCGLEYLGDGIAREIVECGGEKGGCVYLACEVDYSLKKWISELEFERCYIAMTFSPCKDENSVQAIQVPKWTASRRLNVMQIRPKI
jgi:hypothetical protein